MSSLHFKVLPAEQQRLWDEFLKQADFLNDHGYYLAGGTGLALQLGHRRSLDFDFFSAQGGLADSTEDWLRGVTPAEVRDRDQNTLHAEAKGVKVSFISAYRYPTVEPLVDGGSVKLASVVDIALMKLLALTHRAALRDYLDMAAILRSNDLRKLLELGRKKYGPEMNPMIFLRALVAFEDVDSELPVLLDTTLKKDWQSILRHAVKKAA